MGIYCPLKLNHWTSRQNSQFMILTARYLRDNQCAEAFCGIERSFKTLELNIWADLLVSKNPLPERLRILSQDEQQLSLVTCVEKAYTHKQYPHDDDTRCKVFQEVKSAAIIYMFSPNLSYQNAEFVCAVGGIIKSYEEDDVLSCNTRRIKLTKYIESFLNELTGTQIGKMNGICRKFIREILLGKYHVSYSNR